MEEGSLILTNRSMESAVEITKQDTRRTILSAAARLVATNGLTDWSIARCSKEAGCAKGLVLHYFETKEALLREVARSLSADRQREWATALSVGGVGALDALWERL